MRTAIFKQAVPGRVRVHRTRLEGDAPGDPSVHGGRHRAACAYPLEHYRYWERELGTGALSAGAFGENLTVEGLDEASVCIGDRLRLGTAEFVVTHPRMPCYKLGIRFARDDMERRFLQSGRPGFYLAVSREGWIEAGDPVEIVGRHPSRLSVATIFALRTGACRDRALLRAASELEALPESWRQKFASWL